MRRVTSGGNKAPKQLGGADDRKLLKFMVNFEIAVHVEFQKGGGASRGVSMFRIREGGTDTLKRLPNFFSGGGLGLLPIVMFGALN